MAKINSDTLLKLWDEFKKEFPGLKFIEETHTYYVDGVVYPSVSNLLQSFYDKFDTEGESIRYAEKNGFEVSDVIGAWSGDSKVATTKGSGVHLFAEDYVKWRYFNIGEKPMAFTKQCLSVIKFFNDLPEYLYPVAIELQMYTKKYKYCGTTDLLFYNSMNDSFVIADWKTDKELFANPKYPTKNLHHIPKELNLLQDNYGKYTLQFSHYQMQLEGIGLNISSRMLIWLRDTGDSLYSTYRTKDVSKELKEYYESKQ